MLSLTEWLLLIPAAIFAWVAMCVCFAKLFAWCFAHWSPVAPGVPYTMDAEACRHSEVTLGRSPARPEDLAKFVVTLVDGIWMGRMPKQVELNLAGRFGDPVRYERADVIHRIEARHESKRGFYCVGGDEVPTELMLLAVQAFGSSEAALGWFKS